MRCVTGQLSLLLYLVGFFAPVAVAADAPKPGTHTVHGFALYGEPKYGPDFKHFDYVNPNAPKGGTIRFSNQGSFDSFNPYAIRGVSAITILNLTLVYDRLMEPSFDERQSQYGLLAETLTYPDDYAWAEYKLRSNAKWHDGKPITPDDVVFTFNAVKKGTSALSFFVTDVAKAEITGPRTVRFTFVEPNNRRALVSLGLLAIVPKHYWEGKDLTAPAVTPPLSSGPYRVTGFEIGRTFTLERDPNYWGKDVPLNVGRFNYGKIVTDYYRDNVAAFEGFKVHDSDIRFEADPKSWASGYDWPAYKHGDVKRDTIKQQSGFTLQAYFFNTRRDKFKDPVLREALAYAFDFNWINKNFFYGSQVRSESYYGFPDSDLAASGLPKSAELALLGPFRNQVPPRVFTQPFHLPDTDGTEEGLRKNLQTASKMLTAAGYKMKDGKLLSSKTGQPVDFEIMMTNPAYRQITEHWIQNLKLLGVTATIRVIDQAQFIARQQSFDFDMLVSLVPMGPLPGPEQRNIWGSAAADRKGSFNSTGVKNPAIDALIEKVVAAQTTNELYAAVHALDRVLAWNFYAIPLYSTGGKLNVAYWDRIGRPQHDSPFGWPWLNSWWIDPQKDVASKAPHTTSK